MTHPDSALAALVHRPASVGRMFLDRVAETPGHEAFSYPVGTGWESVTWQQTADRVALVAAGLLALGLEAQERVAIASSTRFEWILADLAILVTGGATTTVYPSSRSSDVHFILADSGSRIAFAEDADQLAKLREHRSELPQLAKVVLFDGEDDDDWVLTLAELERLGAERLQREPGIIEQRVAATGPEHLATLIYTSGTTGRPKGVQLPHSAWTYEGLAVDSLSILGPDDVQFLWLPLSHSFGKVLLCLQLAVGFRTAVDGRVERIIDNLAVVRPTFMGAAPRIFEKAHGRIVTMVEAEGGLRKAIFDRAFRVGIAVSRRRRAGEPVPWWLAAQCALFDRLVFAKIRDRFGGRLRFFVSGAAALNSKVAEWFHAAGIVILEGYGLTETAAGTCVNIPGHCRIGSVGRAFPGTDVRVAADGELLIRGPGVMDGYHGQQEQTDEVLRDGWFHTGDIGEIDADGYVWVTDRKKDLFKTSGGKYVAPQTLETLFKALCPYASQFVVHGNERNYCTALVTLDEDAIADWAERNGLAGLTYSEVVTSAAAREMVQGYVDELNARLNRWETIKRFAILDHDLSIDAGELTPSLKVRRRVVEERYGDVLDALYDH